MKKTSRRIRAFTLVEVVLSLGIVSFSLMGIFGLLMLGLSTFHSSIDKTVEAQIAQQIIGQAQLTSYANLTTGSAYSTNFLFDENGQQVAATDSTAIYTASVTFANLSSSMTTNIPSTVGTNFILQLSSKTSPGTTNVYSTVLVNNN